MGADRYSDSLPTAGEVAMAGFGTVAEQQERTIETSLKKYSLNINVHTFTDEDVAKRLEILPNGVTSENRNKYAKDLLKFYAEKQAFRFENSAPIITEVQ